MHGHGFARDNRGILCGEGGFDIGGGRGLFPSQLCQKGGGEGDFAIHPTARIRTDPDVTAGIFRGRHEHNLLQLDAQDRCAVLHGDAIFFKMAGTLQRPKHIFVGMIVLMGGPRNECDKGDGVDGRCGTHHRRLMKSGTAQAAGGVVGRPMAPLPSQRRKRRVGVVQQQIIPFAPLSQTDDQLVTAIAIQIAAGGVCRPVGAVVGGPGGPCPSEAGGPVDQILKNLHIARAAPSQTEDRFAASVAIHIAQGGIGFAIGRVVGGPASSQPSQRRESLFPIVAHLQIAPPAAAKPQQQFG